MALETSPQSPAPVRQVANAIAGWIDRLGAIWVEGQIAQISRRPGVNTVFMTLRDAVADISVSVTCQRTLFDSINPPLVEGASVVVHAKPSFYANRGTLSLYAREIRMVGLGELLARLERRRQLLAAEGLFAAELKRRLPFLPGKVGLVTAPNSAAERDVLENARRRWPAVAFEVAYAAMQGQRAATEVMEALDRLDRAADVDVIVIARGGGSVEDLLPFSDEALIRAVHRARTPVVSAIGHEPDSPRSRPALADPRSLLDARSDEVLQLRDRARRTLGHVLDRAADDIDHRRARARALSPLATLQRGYSVLQDADGHVVTSVDAVATDSPISVRVADGRIHATTTGIDPEPLDETVDSTEEPHG